MEKAKRLHMIFNKTTGTNYNIKIAKRSDLDESNILNPFELKRNPGSTGDSDAIQQTDTVPKQPTGDKLDEFIAKFSNIITDGDRIPENFDPEKEMGEQSSMEEFEDDREEFLTENELPSDDEDN